MANATMQRTVRIAGTGVHLGAASSVTDLAALLWSGEQKPECVELSKHHTLTVHALSKEIAFDDAIGALPVTLKTSERLIRLARTPELRSSLIAAAQAWCSAGLGEVDGTTDTWLIVAGNNLNQRVGFNAATTFTDEQFVSPTYGYLWLDTHVLGAISEGLGLHGFGTLTGASSASGAVAVVQAFHAIRAGLCDRCLVVAPPTWLSATEAIALASIGALAGLDESHAVPCNPFDKTHNGFVAGEGAAALVLEARDESVDAGEICVLGANVCLDGHARTEPNAKGEARAMRAAIDDAGLSPAQIDYVNAHGTASVLGDAEEVVALKSVFAGMGSFPPVNATKAMTGHCLSASGLIEIIASAEQLRARRLHGNRYLTDPIDGEIPFVGPHAVDWNGHTALSASYAFGGINAAVVLGRTPGGNE